MHNFDTLVPNWKRFSLSTIWVGRTHRSLSFGWTQRSLEIMSRGGCSDGEFWIAGKEIRIAEAHLQFSSFASFHSSFFIQFLILILKIRGNWSEKSSSTTLSWKIWRNMRIWTTWTSAVHWNFCINYSITLAPFSCSDAPKIESVRSFSLLKHIWLYFTIFSEARTRKFLCFSMKFRTKQSYQKSFLQQDKKRFRSSRNFARGKQNVEGEGT
jgi:hypothetical protein